MLAGSGDFMNMKTGLAVTAFVVVMASSAMADAFLPGVSRTSAVCNSGTLEKADQDFCRAQMQAATTEAQRAQIRAAIADKIRQRQVELDAMATPA